MGMVLLTDVPGIGEATAAKLRDAGVSSAEELADAVLANLGGPVTGLDSASNRSGRSA